MTTLGIQDTPLSTTIWPGTWYPLGATYDGEGCNFSVFSEVAERVDLCLFDDTGHERRVALPESRTFCWHGYVPGIQPRLAAAFAAAAAPALRERLRPPPSRPR